MVGSEEFHGFCLCKCLRTPNAFLDSATSPFGTFPHPFLTAQEAETQESLLGLYIKGQKG